MMAPLFALLKGNKGRHKGYSLDTDYSHLSRPQRLASCSNHISHTLLYFMMRDHDWNTASGSLMLLAADLLGVSLAHADYSDDLVSLLGLLVDGRLTSMLDSSCLPRLAQIVSNYCDVRAMICTAICTFQQENLQGFFNSL